MPSLSPTFARLAVVTALATYAAAQATDYLIVGGGTAGLVLAERLTEDPNVSVLVIEAGGNGLGKCVIFQLLYLLQMLIATPSVNISDINLIGAAWGTDIDWQFPTQPLYYANDRQLTPSPRGKVLWNFNTLFNASKKGEIFSAPNASENIDYVLGDHGVNGLLSTSYNGTAPEFHDTIIQGVVNAGGNEEADLASGTVVGISHITNARLPTNSTRATS
ncbi:hypothetical protein H0H92_009264, partial [Tricholoma furcatifolium]